MRKYMVIAVIAIMVLVSLVCITSLDKNVKAEDEIFQRSSVFMYGDVSSGNDGNLTTNKPTNKTGIAVDLFAEGANPFTEYYIGKWVTEPMAHEMKIDGPANFSIWASGNVNNIHFRARVTNERTYNPNSDSTYNDITTNTANLGDTPQVFYGEINITRVFQEGDRLAIRVYWQADAELGLNPEARIHYASKNYDSNLSVLCDSLKVIPTWDTVNYPDGKITFKAEFVDAFGNYDIVNDSWSIKITDKDGNIQNSVTELRSEATHNTINIYWIWDYGADEAEPGDYDITVSVIDNNGNIWSGNSKFPLTQIAPPLVDVQLETILLSNEKPNVGEKVYINATLLAFDSFEEEPIYVEVRFYVNEIPIDNVTLPIKIGSSRIATTIWIPKKEEVCTIKVVLDPDEYIKDKKRENNFGEKTIAVGKAKIQKEENKWYEELWDDIEDNNYLPIIIPVIIVIVVGSVIGIRKKRSKAEFEEKKEETKAKKQ